LSSWSADPEGQFSNLQQTWVYLLRYIPHYCQVRPEWRHLWSVIRSQPTSGGDKKSEIGYSPHRDRRTSKPYIFKMLEFAGRIIAYTRQLVSAELFIIFNIIAVRNGLEAPLNFLFKVWVKAKCSEVLQRTFIGCEKVLATCQGIANLFIC
jgi:hypothetical protein